METAIFIGWRECFRKPEEAGKSTGKIWTPEGINARRAVRISDWIAQAGTAEKGCGGIAVKKIHRTGKGRCQKKVIQQLYAQVEAESSKHAVSDLCRIYEVSRSGYYKWLRRKEALNSFEQRQNELDYLVDDIHAHEPSLGYRMIADRLLMETGRSVSDLSVYRSMKRLKIQGYVFRKKHPTQPGNEHKKLPNI